MYTLCSLETFTASRRLTDTQHRSRHRLSNDQIARQFWSGQLRYLKVSYWPIGDLRLKGSSPGLRTPMYPYVAPRTAKIHTLITLGISIRTKWLVFWLRTHRPCGFDSHRPLHFPLSGVSVRCSGSYNRMRRLPVESVFAGLILLHRSSAASRERPFRGNQNCKHAPKRALALTHEDSITQYTSGREFRPFRLLWESLYRTSISNCNCIPCRSSHLSTFVWSHVTIINSIA